MQACEVVNGSAEADVLRAKDQAGGGGQLRETGGEGRAKGHAKGSPAAGAAQREDHGGSGGPQRKAPETAAKKESSHQLVFSNSNLAMQYRVLRRNESAGTPCSEVTKRARARTSSAHMRAVCGAVQLSFSVPCAMEPMTRMRTRLPCVGEAQRDPRPRAVRAARHRAGRDGARVPRRGHPPRAGRPA